MTINRRRRNPMNTAQRFSQHGFTLIELMIVVVIIGVLMAIALPNYNEYVLKGKLAEASSTLSTAQLKLEQFYQDNRTYATADPALGPCGVKNFTGTNFDFTCTPTNNGQNFTCTATGKNAAAGFIYTVTDANIKGTTLPSGSTVTCWATSKSGSC